MQEREMEEFGEGHNTQTEAHNGPTNESDDDCLLMQLVHYETI